MTLHIRQAETTDAALILRFITELAVYEKAEEEVLATVETIQATLLSDAPAARAVICEVDGEPAGFAVYFYSYSTWLSRKGLYLEDLYVTPACRGRGAGKALLKHLARIAVDNDCGRFEWSVLDWNAPAIAFYDAAGAVPQNEWIRYRLAGEALQAFAEN